MPSTYSPLKIELPATGEQSGTWGNTTNTNLGTALEEAIVGSADVTFASGNVTLTLTDTNASQPARNLRLNLIGVTGGSTRTLTVPAIEKLYLVSNNCADAVVVGNATGATVTVPAGNNIFIYNDGTDVLNAITYITALNAATVAAGSVTTTQVDIVSQGDLRLQDTTGGQFVALQAPGTIATSYTLTLPVDDGTAGQALITDGNGILSWSTEASGDVYGPASATDNAIARFDLTTGKIIQNSVVTIADTTGNMAGVGTLSSGAITTTGVLTVPAGTVSAPAITTTGDTNTGIFFPAADTIAFAEGGAEAMRINSSGNVGIGTSSPANFVDISRTINQNTVVRNVNASAEGSATATFRVENSTSTFDMAIRSVGAGPFNAYEANSGILNYGGNTSLVIAASNAAGVIKFTSGGLVERMRITSAGLVGIGTSSPGVLLDVSGGLGRIIPSGGSVNTPESGAGTLNVYGASSDISTRTGALRIESFSDSGANVGTGIAFSGRYITSNAASWTFAKIGGYKEVSTNGGAGGYLAVATTTSGGVLTERMRITSAGEVLIGTTTAIGAGLTVAASGASIYLTDTNGTAQTWRLLSKTGTTSQFRIFDQTQLVDRLVIDSSGNVGIGTSSPASNLQIRAANPDIYLTSDNTGQADIFFGGSTAPTKGLIRYSDNSDFFAFSTNSSERLRIDSTGNVGIGTSSPVNILDVVSTENTVFDPTNSTGQRNVGTSLRIFNQSTTQNSFAQIVFQNRNATIGVSRIASIMTGASGNGTALAFVTETDGGNPTERMRLDSLGNLGLGVTPSAWVNTKAFQTGSRGSVSEEFVNNGKIAFSSNVYATSSTAYAYSVAGFATSYQQVNGQHQWYNAPSSTAGNTVSFTQAMTLDASGNLGIGTTSPDTKLHISANAGAVIRLENPQSTSTTGVSVGKIEWETRDASAPGVIAYIDVVDSNNFGTAFDMAFATGTSGTATERMRIGSTGNVGIGTTAPSAKLEILKSSTDTVFTDQNYPADSSGITILNPSVTDSNFTALTFLLSNTAGVSQSASIIAQSTSSGFAANLIFTQRTSSNVNTERMRIDSTGNVGIGTSSPSEKLTVSGNTSLSGNLTFTGTGNRILGDFSNATLASRVSFQTSTTNGNTSINAIPNGTASTSNYTIWNSSDVTNAAFGQLTILGGTDVRLASGVTGTGTALPLTIHTGGSERLRIDTSGNVGIGTTAPNATLHLGAGGASLRIGITASNQYGDLYRDGPSGNIILNAAQAGFGSLVFQTTSTERMRIDSSGNVGIGFTGAADQRLATRGSDTTSSNYAFVASNSAAATLFFIRNDGFINTGTAAASPYNSTTGSAANMVVDASGHLGRSTSSLKYKTNVQETTHGLSEVMQLRPVTYKGINDGDTVFGGLIAEEVHEAGLREFVQYAEDGTPDALAYGNMVSLAFKAIQELKATVDAQAARIAALESK
jgi:hypothetical protein